MLFICLYLENNVIYFFKQNMPGGSSCGERMMGKN